MKLNVINEERQGTKGYKGYDEKYIDIYNIGAISKLTKMIFVGKHGMYRLTKESFKKLKKELLKHDKTKDLVLGL